MRTRAALYWRVGLALGIGNSAIVASDTWCCQNSRIGVAERGWCPGIVVVASGTIGRRLDVCARLERGR